MRVAESGKFAGLPYLGSATGPAAIENWRRLRGLLHSRRCPVLVDKAEGAYRHSDEQSGSVEEIAAAGEAMDVTHRWPRLLAEGLDRHHPPGATWPAPSDTTRHHGPWPAEPAERHDFVGPHWGDAANHPMAYILLPACPEPWMIPAYLGAQPHNDLPDAALQCAVMRSWHRRFGAEVVYTNGVVYEFAVGRPPTDHQTALQLAHEHFLFCPDRVNQWCPDSRLYPSPGDDTLEALAAMLMNSTVWYFWWD